MYPNGEIVGDDTLAAQHIANQVVRRPGRLPVRITLDAGNFTFDLVIVGRASTVRIADMDITTIGLYSIALLALIGGGIYLSGVIL